MAPCFALVHAPIPSKSLHSQAIALEQPQEPIPIQYASLKQYPRLGFTKSNELFVGRMAMLGFAAGLIGEVMTGDGILAQLGYETGLMSYEINRLILGLIGFNLVAAFAPASGRFVQEDAEELAKTPAGPLQDVRITPLQPKKYFGFSDFGFTKENELFVGRVAQLGFAAALIGEVMTGQGPLVQLGYETGIPLQDAEAIVLAIPAFFLLAAVNPGTGRFVDEDAEEETVEAEL